MSNFLQIVEIIGAVVITALFIIFLVNYMITIAGSYHACTLTYMYKKYKMNFLQRMLLCTPIIPVQIFKTENSVEDVNKFLDKNLKYYISYVFNSQISLLNEHDGTYIIKGKLTPEHILYMELAFDIKILNKFRVWETNFEMLLSDTCLK